MKKRKIPKPFIYYEGLKYWEKATIVIYALITLGVALSPCVLSLVFRRDAIIGYAIMTQLSFLLFLYVSLRNFRFYLIWLYFGVIHFILFLCFKGSSELKIIGNPSRLLANTLPLLFLFQMLRYFSVKAQQREFVSPAKGYEGDLIENKKPTGADYVISIIYVGMWFGLTILSASHS
jgi:hypothetical protein